MAVRPVCLRQARILQVPTAHYAGPRGPWCVQSHGTVTLPAKCTHSLSGPLRAGPSLARAPRPGLPGALAALCSAGAYLGRVVLATVTGQDATEY